eukprot:TRINITY_DN1134_c0_g2_i1.p1 TRINITY_DN1134_c0_g2~~TRINITY_DN1134_c0_g2_i1.p1  ORF type:complete len:219 (+),score=21.62 TRINITY_DN1134_c0_g2_i1:81-737(+)
MEEVSSTRKGDPFILGGKGLVCVVLVVLLSWLGCSAGGGPPPSTRPDFSLSFSADAFVSIDGNINGTVQWYQDFNTSALLWVGFSELYYGEGYHLELYQQHFVAYYNESHCTSCHNDQCCGHESCNCSTESIFLQMWTFYENTTYAGQCGDDGQGSTWFTNYDRGHGSYTPFRLCYNPVANAPLWVHVEGMNFTFSNWIGQTPDASYFAIPSICGCQP